MATKQGYRGAPSVKQYDLTNNFIGGLNVVAAESELSDIEFRELQNVSLDIYGNLRNRKGFGDFVVLNEILTDNTIVIPAGSYRLFKLVKNTNNVLKIMSEYDTLAEFNTIMTTLAYSLHILLSSDSNIYLLKIEKNSGSTSPDTVSLTTLHTFTSFTSFKEDKTPIVTTDVLDEVFFSISEIGVGESGIGRYNIETEVFDIINDTNCYEPTPYEIVDPSLGFNVLATNPLTFIDDQGISYKSYKGAFITRISDGAPLSKIPPSGNFKLNIIVTGSNFSHPQVKLEFKKDDGTALSYRITSATTTSGLISFTIDELDVQNVGAITIVLNINHDINFSFSTGDYPYFISGADYVETTKDTYQLWYTAATPPYSQDNFVGRDIEYSAPDLITLQAYSGTEGNFYVVTGTPNQYYQYSSGVYNQISFGVTYERRYEFLSDVFPKYTGYYREAVSGGSDFRYLYYNGGTSNSIADYSYIDNYNPDETILEFQQTFDIGEDTEAEVVSSLDLEDIKIREIKNRLVYFYKNIMWFSELFQFDYIPNLNFVSLPISANDEITNIAYFRGTYIIFTKEEIWKLKGTFGFDDFGVSRVNTFVGCPFPETIKNVGNTLIFLSSDGLYRLKNNYYQDDLENVEKIDKFVSSLIDTNSTFTSVVYKEQYYLIDNEGRNFDSLRMYYNIKLRNGFSPFVLDIYGNDIPSFAKMSNNLMSLNGGRFYIFDKGYTDLMPDGTDTSLLDNYLYDCKIKTGKLSFGYPTHIKKFKNIYIKTSNGEKVVPLFITIELDGNKILDPNSYTAVRLPTGEIEYRVLRENELSIIAASALGQFELGLTSLGTVVEALYKIQSAGKGHSISLLIEQRLDSSFGIEDIGYSYKLGKVKETR